MSISTRSASCQTATWTASSPSPATPTTSQPGCASTIVLSSIAKPSSSSATTTRSGLGSPRAFCTYRHQRGRGATGCGSSDGDVVADADRAVVQDVRVQAGAVDHLLDDPRPRERLQVGARLAELDAEALDLADAEALPDEVVQAHAADDDLAARLGASQADL